MPDKKMLEGFSTRELVAELITREGVKELDSLEPGDQWAIKFEGPCRVLEITD